MLRLNNEGPISQTLRRVKSVKLALRWKRLAQTRTANVSRVKWRDARAGEPFNVPDTKLHSRQTTVVKRSTN
ncbi:hypothetical protein P4O66_017306 [Electrophorus voltai]|uniref:Uncharacterized protein n=1 Tax=Electrophorus voltai TaxID=2609070 RepID=A0AAD8YUY3_9TELE|nr:hypothetical protein P4O66_017306 [Electrophorus voltai]